jgi:hypothetical protein
MEKHIFLNKLNWIQQKYARCSVMDFGNTIYALFFATTFNLQAMIS